MVPMTSALAAQLTVSPYEDHQHMCGEFMEAQGKLRGDDSGKYSVDRAMAQLHFAWFLPCTEEPTGQHPVRMKVGKGSVNKQSL